MHPHEATHREIIGFRASRRKDDLRRLGTDYSRDTLAGIFHGETRLTSEAMHRRRVAVLLFQERHHRIEDPRIERRSEEHTSELQSRGHLVCRLLLAKK